ncbi:hypothetical protein BD560DRAFT_408079 [Blakeslea trispora]|nr:hypothetical protein BD560DRAFT_408079 [Blakeslea trispora]
MYSLENSDHLPWKDSLYQSYLRNYDFQIKHGQKVFLSMSNIKRSGDNSMHCIPFLGFLEDDVRFLKFSLAINDNALMGDIKSNPNAKLSWVMPKTNEYYNFKGRFYIASAPIQITRFPPPKIEAHTSPASAYWEEKRLRQWAVLDDASRATFTWPSKGETPKSADISYSCQSLKHMEKGIIYDIALDNFCLLIYKMTEIEHLDYSVFPPRRMSFTLCTKTNKWRAQAANP